MTVNFLQNVSAKNVEKKKTYSRNIHRIQKKTLLSVLRAGNLRALTEGLTKYGGREGNQTERSQNRKGRAPGITAKNFFLWAESERWTPAKIPFQVSDVQAWSSKQQVNKCTENPPSATSRRRMKRRRGRGGEADLHFKPPGEDLCGQIHPRRHLSSPPVSLSSSLSHALFLSPSDRFIKRRGSKTGPQLPPHPSLFLLFFVNWQASLPPPVSVFSRRPVPGPENTFSSSAERKKKGVGGGWRMETRRWRQKRRQAEKMNMCDSPCGLLLKIFCHSDTLAQTCHFLSFSAHWALLYFSKTSGGISWRGRARGKKKKNKKRYTTINGGHVPIQASVSIRLSDAPRCF